MSTSPCALVIPEGASPEDLRQVALEAARRHDHLVSVQDDLLALATPEERTVLLEKFAAARVAFEGLLAELERGE